MLREKRAGPKNKQLLNDLKAKTEETLTKIKGRVNELLNAFGAGFRVRDIREERPRGQPVAGWELEICRTPVKLGTAQTPSSEPSFENTLSAGDRSALAFAFFLAQLEQKPDLAERIVVLDDPFTSQDWFRRSATKGCLVELLQRAGQLILCSHDSRFLLDVHKSTKTIKDIQTLEIRFADEDGSRLLEEDLLFIARVTARADLQELRAFLERGGGKPIDIVRKIRPVLEAAFRRAYPEIVTSTMMLGKILEIARRGQGPLGKWSAVLEELNEYTRQYHHGEDTHDGEWPPIDSRELRSQVQKALAMAGPILDDKAS